MSNPVHKGRTRIDVSDSILRLILKSTAFHKALPHRFVYFYRVQHGRVGKQLPKLSCHLIRDVSGIRQTSVTDKDPGESIRVGCNDP